MTYNVFSGTLNPTHFTSLCFHRRLLVFLIVNRITRKVTGRFLCNLEKENSWFNFDRLWSGFLIAGRLLVDLCEK